MERSESDSPTGAGSSRREELLRDGAEADGVEITEYEPREPFSPGTRRGRRIVASWWAVTVLAGLAAMAVFLFWPWRYVPPHEPGHTLYVLYTPMLGLFLGLSVLGVSVALVQTVKRLLPREVSVQQRHLRGGSSEHDRETFVATLRDAQDQSGLNRRSLLGRAAMTGTSVLGAGLGVVGIGAFVRDPWDGRTPSKIPEDTLWHTGWFSPEETVYLRIHTSDPTEVKLARPGDLAPASSLTVFPFRESERDDPKKLARAFEHADDPVDLYRLPPDTTMADRPDRAGMHYRDYYAFSRVCTHLGCPVGMYKPEEQIVMCPCHLSEFDLTTYASPVFGPATRALPQLPIGLSEDGHFIALGDFTGPVGPAFWELGG